jgi:hypothetical protein
MLDNMSEPTTPRHPFGPPPRGTTQSDVSHAADALLRAGERPTIEKIRTKIGKGSPNTINPMLDAWWKTLAARLDAGPAALHRLPESIAHVAESLWMQALEEGRQRARTELKTSERQNADQEQALSVRSHVLTLREGELDSRVRDRDRTIEDLDLRLRVLTGALRKAQVTREFLEQQISGMQSKRALRKRVTSAPRRKKASVRQTNTRKGAISRAKGRRQRR